MPYKPPTNNLFLMPCCMAALCFMLTACSLRIGEKAFTRNTAYFSLGCLNNMEQKITSYIQGSLNQQEIDQISNCAIQALTIFKDRVRGSKTSSFTPEELRTFIQNLFLQDKTINDNLLSQIMHLKSVIIGGPKHILTKDDIDRFIYFLNILKEEIMFFQPYVQALLSYKNFNYIVTQNNFKTMDQQIKNSVVRLSKFFKLFAHPYYFTDIQNLMYELDLIVDGKAEQKSWIQKIRLLSAFKYFMVNGSKSAIGPEEWENLLPGYMNLASAFLHYKVLMATDNFISPYSMDLISTITNKLMGFLSMSLNTRPGGGIPVTDFSWLIMQLQSTGFLPFSLREASIQKLMKMWVLRILKTKDKAPASLKNQNTAFTHDHIKQLQNMVQTWTTSTQILNQAYGKYQMNPFSLTQIKTLPPGKEDTHAPASVWQHIEKVFALKPLYKKTSFVRLSQKLYHPSPLKKDYRNLVFNNIYTMMEWILRKGYEAGYPSKLGMTREQLNKFFADFTPFATDMQWLDGSAPSSISPSEAAFIAANMFTPSAAGFDPDPIKTEYLKPYEIVEYLSYVFSIFFSIQDFEKQLLKVCHRQKNQNGQWNYDRFCVKLHFISIVEKQLSHMPRFLDALKHISPVEKEHLTDALIHISFESEEAYKTTTRLEYFHIRNMFIALYFGETIFNRYDTNHSRVLEHTEIMNAFSLFEGFTSRTLMEFMCWDREKSQKLARSIYAHILYNKQVPEGEGWFSQAWTYSKLMYHNTNYHLRESDTWELELKGRKDLIRILSVIIKGYLKQKEARTDELCL